MDREDDVKCLEIQKGEQRESRMGQFSGCRLSPESFSRLPFSVDFSKVCQSPACDCVWMDI